MNHPFAAQAADGREDAADDDGDDEAPPERPDAEALPDVWREMLSPSLPPSDDGDDDDDELNPWGDQTSADEAEAPPDEARRPRPPRKMPSSRIPVYRSRDVASFRARVHCDDGHRFEIVVPKRKTQQLGLVVYASGAVDFGDVTYGASLVVVDVADDALPTIRVAFATSGIRRGDRVVGVNKRFPDDPGALHAMLLNGKRKRRLTIIRSAHAPGVDAALVDEKKRAGLVVTA